LTGGEPLIRRDIEFLIENLARISGVKDLALTTNADGLKQRAATLRAAGLSRLTICSMA
jgi:cyclic pyranopterin phosphate synthase